MKLEQILPLLREKGGKVKVANRPHWGVWDLAELKKQIKEGGNGWSKFDPWSDDIFEYVKPPLKDTPRSELYPNMIIGGLNQIFNLYADDAIPQDSFIGFASSFGFVREEVKDWMLHKENYKPV